MKFFINLFSKPIEIPLTITSSNGFHLRPVAQFCHRAKSFPAKITASFQGRSVDAKNITSLLSLSLDKQDTVILKAQGKEAQQAIDSLQELFSNLMQKETEIQVVQKRASLYQRPSIEGDIIYQGIAIAPLYAFETTHTQEETTLSYREALAHSIDALEAMYLSKNDQSDATIYLAQKELLIALGERCHTLEALENTIAIECQQLKGSTLASKISDYQDILHQVQSALGYTTTLLLPQTPSILIADDLLPSHIALLTKSHIQGVILRHTSINSHTSILLRASAIPSLILDDAQLIPSEEVILDSYTGEVILHPSQEDKQKAKASQKIQQSKDALSYEKRFESTATKAGKTIQVFANVSDVASAKHAKQEGAEGIGLLRSEFLFQAIKPTLEAQTKAYQEIFALFEDITVRTIDVGGDKALPYIDIPVEKNPFLGVRGIRLCTTHPEIIQEQFHAIFLASQNRKSTHNLKIMFPMVSTVEEFNKAKTLAQHTAQKHHIDISHIDFGIMIEVPSVLFLIRDFDKVVDFYSIGTNDLTQYLFATERTHPLLKTDALSPVIFSAIQSILTQTTKPISICGELASNPQAIPPLITLGIKTLSVSSKMIARTKERVRSV